MIGMAGGSLVVTGYPKKISKTTPDIFLTFAAYLNSVFLPKNSLYSGFFYLANNFSAIFLRPIQQWYNRNLRPAPKNIRKIPL
jgi:hypothetical protein